jgi:hypothetical protein
MSEGNVQPPKGEGIVSCQSLCMLWELLLIANAARESYSRYLPVGPSPDDRSFSFGNSADFLQRSQTILQKGSWEDPSEGFG